MGRGTAKPEGPLTLGIDVLPCRSHDPSRPFSRGFEPLLGLLVSRLSERTRLRFDRIQLDKERSELGRELLTGGNGNANSSGRWPRRSPKASETMQDVTERHRPNGSDVGACRAVVGQAFDSFAYSDRRENQTLAQDEIRRDGAE